MLSMRDFALSYSFSCLMRYVRYPSQTVPKFTAFCFARRSASAFATASASRRSSSGQRLDGGDTAGESMISG